MLYNTYLDTRAVVDVFNAFVQKNKNKTKCKKGAFTNSVDSDETPNNEVSHQSLLYLPC